MDDPTTALLQDQVKRDEEFKDSYSINPSRNSTFIIVSVHGVDEHLVCLDSLRLLPTPRYLGLQRGLVTALS